MQISQTAILFSGFLFQESSPAFIAAQKRLRRKNPSSLTASHFLPVLLHDYCLGLCSGICLTRRVHLERIHHAPLAVRRCFATTKEVNTCSLFLVGEGEEERDPADLVPSWWWCFF